MKWQGTSQQQRRDFMYDASGVTVANEPGLVLARSLSRSYLYLANNSNGPLWFEFDGPRATATITNGVVTSVALTNAGFNFTRPPVIRFEGGGPGGGGGKNINTSYLGLGQPDSGSSPSHVAKGVAVMTGSPGNQGVASITISDGGSGYVCAPYVHIYSDDLDPYGVAIPSAGVGIMITAGGEKEWNGSCCPTESISVFGAGVQGFICRFMT